MLLFLIKGILLGASISFFSLIAINILYRRSTLSIIFYLFGVALGFTIMINIYY